MTERMTPADLMALTKTRGFTNARHQGPESVICVDFANGLREMTLTGALTAPWTHVANEGNLSKPMRARLAAEGLMPGTTDYVFLPPGALVMEAKSKSGVLSDNQKLFRRWCEASAVEWHLFRDADDGLRIVKDWAGA